MRSSQPSPPIHGEHEGHDARSSSRAVSRSSIRSVVRLGPATGIRARKPRLLPHARERLCDPRFQAKITSPSRLPLSRSRARRVVDPKVAARGRAGELEILCRVLQARLSMLLAFDDVHGHAARPHIPFDLAPHSSVDDRSQPRTFRRVENETLALIRSPSPSVARSEIAL